MKLILKERLFFGLAQVAQLITEMFRFWRTGKTEINKIGSKRRYFGGGV